MGIPAKSDGSRVEAILAAERYRQYMEHIHYYEVEHKRRFCRHDYRHCLDTARVAYLLYLTGEVPCPEFAAYDAVAVKELIYAAAFLHDIARHLEYNDPRRDHAEEGAVLARPLLAAAGFNGTEQALVLKAIAHHRRQGDPGFDLLLYRADKESRPCMFCEVRSECKHFDGKKQPALKY